MGSGIINAVHSVTMTTIGLTAISLFSVLVAIRVYFHPLSKYPGPLLAKVSSLYVAYHVYRGDNHTNLALLHQKYGDIVRIGPNTLSMLSATALKDIYGHGSTLVKNHDFYSAFSAIPGLYNTHNAVNKKMHSRKRRVLAHAFSETALKEFEGLMMVQQNHLCDQLELGKKPKDVSQWFNYFTYDVMGELCFGSSFSMMDDESSRYIMRMVDTVSHASSVFGWLPILKSLRLDRLLMFTSLAADRWRFVLEARKQADNRMKREVDSKKDFFYYLMKAKDPETGEPFTSQELWEEATMLMVAGSDTTSTALAGTMFYLVKNPECMAIAAKEVQTIFNSEEEISHGPKLSQCVYLRNCVDEALRLSPPIPGILPRTIVQTDTIIAGEKLPPGITVGTPCWALHHDERYFPEPEKFRPSRWTEDPEDQRELARSAYAPFSVGPRGCIGKSLALMESRSTIAKLLWRFSITAQYGLPTSYMIDDHFTACKKGPYLMFERRETMD